MRDDFEKMRTDLLHHQEDDKKQFAHLSDLLEGNTLSLRRHDAEFRDIKKLLEEMSKESNAVNQWFKNITLGKKMLMGLLAFLSVVVGILWGIKQIISK